MAGQDLASLRATIEMAANRDPGDDRARRRQMREEQERQERIAAARPETIRRTHGALMEAIGDDTVKEWLAERGGRRGDPSQMMPAQIERDMFEGRSKLVNKLLKDQFSQSEIALAGCSLSPVSEWEDHLKAKGWSLRDTISYDAESQGERLTKEQLDDREATKNFYKRFGHLSEGVHGPNLGKYISNARENGRWPHPGLYTGSEGTYRLPQDYSLDDFERDCQPAALKERTTTAHRQRDPMRPGHARIPRLQDRSHAAAQPHFETRKVPDLPRGHGDARYNAARPLHQGRSEGGWFKRALNFVARPFGRGNTEKIADPRPQDNYASRRMPPLPNRDMVPAQSRMQQVDLIPPERLVRNDQRPPVSVVRMDPQQTRALMVANRDSSRSDRSIGL